MRIYREADIVNSRVPVGYPGCAARRVMRCNVGVP
jgi:hypothetical protein